MGKNSNEQTLPLGVSAATMTNIEACVGPALVMEGLALKSSIKSVACDVKQIPAEENGYLGVGSATVETYHGKYTGIGASTPVTMDGEPNIQKTIDRACLEGLKRAVGIASMVECGKALLLNEDDGKYLVVDRDGSLGKVAPGNEIEVMDLPR